MNYEQNNWVELLSVTQIVYNLAVTELIEVSSFYINYSFNSETSEFRELITIVLKVKVQIKHQQNLLETL